MTREQYDALWDAVTAGEVEDHTPFGMGGDWCPFCGADWKRPHDEGCESPYAARPDTCRHCGEAIGVEQGRWATTDPNRDGPWYCAANPDAGKQHELR
jgi:Fe-S-cluster containining protein